MEHSGFEFLHPDDVDHMSETLSKLLETPGITIRDEYRHRRKEGGWVYLEAMGTNYLHELSVGGIVLNIRNITERKQAEEALRERRGGNTATSSTTLKWGYSEPGSAMGRSLSAMTALPGRMVIEPLRSV